MEPGKCVATERRRKKRSSSSRVDGKWKETTKTEFPAPRHLISDECLFTVENVEYGRQQSFLGDGS